MEENIIENTEKQQINKRGKFALLSLIFFLVRIILIILGICTALFKGLLTGLYANSTSISLVSIFSIMITIVSWIPWVIVSLIFAIIGKVKDKDKMSTVMLIIDIVYISLQVLLFIVGILLIVLGAIATTNYY